MELVTLLQTSPAWLMLTAGVARPGVGSFLNVVLHPPPLMMPAPWRRDCPELEGREAPAEAPLNLVTPPSRCPSCGTAIRAIHNVPVVSWIALGGKCAKCAAPISARYPLVEVLGGLVAVLFAWRFGFSAQLAA